MSGQFLPSPSRFTTLPLSPPSRPPLHYRSVIPSSPKDRKQRYLWNGGFRSRGEHPPDHLKPLSFPSGAIRVNVAMHSARDPSSWSGYPVSQYNMPLVWFQRCGSAASLFKLNFSVPGLSAPATHGYLVPDLVLRVSRHGFFTSLDTIGL